MIAEKCWRHVEIRLITRESLYYAGGTLCVDNIGKPGGIGLNINGKGFVYTCHHHLKNGVVYLPKHITKLVHEIYNETRGEALFQKRLQEA